MQYDDESKRASREVRRSVSKKEASVMGRLVKLVGAVGVFLLCSTPGLSHSENPQDLLDQLGQAVQEIKTIDAQMQANLELKQQHEKEYERLQEDGEQYERYGEEYDSGKDHFESACGGPLPEAQYDPCNQEKAELDAMWEELDQWRSRRISWKEDLDRAERERGEEAKRLGAKRKSLADQANRILAELQRLRQFRRANQECANLQSLEEIHHCMRRLWEGTR